MEEITFLLVIIDCVVFEIQKFSSKRNMFDDRRLIDSS